MPTVLAGADQISGSFEDDYLLSYGGDDELSGFAGNDTLDGGAGADTMSGGTGHDNYYVDDSSDQVIETGSAPIDGMDAVYTSLGAYALTDNVEYLRGTSATGQTLTGNALANEITGNAGADTLDGSTGADAMYGGAGADIYYADNAGDRAYESAVAGIDRVNSSVSFLLGANVEDLTLTGTAAINGFGNSQNNVMFGNSGNNVLNGSLGADTMNGGGGNDTYYVDNAGDRAIEASAAGGADRVFSSVSFLLGANVEDLTLTGTAAINGFGNTLNNVMVGNSGNNVLNGSLGADIMNGAGGNDTYYVDNLGDRAIEASVAGGIDRVYSSVSFALGNYVDDLTLTGALAANGIGNSLNNSIAGNSGSNILNGGAGNDSLNGGAGADQLYGGPGHDSLTGGTGADRFIFNATLNAATNLDIILDFSVVDDTIVLDQTIFGALPSSGTLAPAAFHIGTAAHDADDRIIYDTTTGRIYYDADGNGAGAQVLFAQIGAGFALTNADFLMVP
ncbi:calcium-binding protein [Sphingomonas sp.]|uniref:calcium-binding protein n=1 Tax=Sphingomonas sp. TaxID=28214 RepID=UPI00286E2F15|nr:calcium-binding protein [Sphingomonas sp.]